MEDIKTEVFQALGTASMCWEPRPSSQVFDSTLAKKVGDELMEKIENNIPLAIQILTKALKEDKSEGSYYFSWQANIAVCQLDAERWYKEKTGKKYLNAEDKHIIANNGAKNFLNLLIR